MRYFGLLRGMRRAPATWTRKLTEAASNLDAPRVRIHDTGPAVLWALPRALILLPKDFVERYGDAPARELVLHHELTHVRRGDAWWTLAMEIASVLLWFHPLAWFSRPRFRLDQELACDAASLRTLPNCTASYARTLLDSIAVQPAPALIPWLVESQLKERIAMITRVPPGALRRRVGFVAVAALLAGGLFAVGGQMPAEAAAQHSPASKPPSVDVHYKNDNPPRYPVDELSNGEQGTVMLRIHVDANGTVTRVDIDKAKTTTTSAELQAAAVTAAENWKFHAGVKGSQPSGGWMTVPVRFALQPAASS
jgi:TonB family protein